MNCGNCESTNKINRFGLCFNCSDCMTEKELFAFISEDNVKFRKLKPKLGKCKYCKSDSANQKVVNRLCIDHYCLCKSPDCLKRATSSEYCNMHQINAEIASSSGSDPTFESADSPVSGGGSVSFSVMCCCKKDKYKTEDCTSFGGS